MRGGRCDGADDSIKVQKKSFAGSILLSPPTAVSPAKVGGSLISRVIQMTTMDVEHDPETALHADVVAAAANT